MLLKPRYSCTKKKISWGLIRHQRFTPKPHRFSIPSCCVRLHFKLEKDEPQHITTDIYPTIDKSSLCCIMAQNYGIWNSPNSMSDVIHELRKTIWGEFTNQSKRMILGVTSFEQLGVEIELQTFPKLFGFVFNPVSFWFFYGYLDNKKTCQAIVCEVNNTFGKRHLYVLFKANQTMMMDSGHLLHATKVFHVSPFFPTSGRYEFRFMNQKNRAVARITYIDAEQVQLITSISGQFKEATLYNWTISMFKYGWFTMLVFIKIHWHAFILWTKGAIFHSEPNSVTALDLNNTNRKPKGHFSSNLNP